VTRTRWVVVVAILATALAVAWSARPHPVSDADRVDRIAAELRCPVCQGLSVEDSPSDTARSMKALIATRVAEGRTDDEIRAEFQRSYGDWILLSPPLVSANGLVWLAPLAAIIAGGLFALQRTRAPALPVAEATAAAVRELRERVAREEREEQES
jgi:cytochrome c-type biogenesis protein CcmH